ncbi:DNA-binding MarR family transcriptional regulator [Hoeflea marina]|uniref:DNA-binding MarR family transcriptional regulator n=1 Tax=Hoeflea marina TaxID=274592 RepID=A0A317PEL9_9HYPH|nr:MarR family transcriptional regulator [Hoeflea marina]PWV97174.1 DNA-binding MarR family transcriptional regulator [Hoeflea marina]
MAGKSKKGKSRDVPIGAVVTLLGQVARNSRTVLSRNLLDLGLYAGQDGVMLALDRQDGQTPGMIASELGVKAPTITKTISRLAVQGFVRREDSTTDGRMSLVFLTDAGRSQIRAIGKAQRRTEKTALAGLKGKQVRQLLDLLQLVDGNLAQSSSPAAPLRPQTDMLSPSKEADIDDLQTD